MIETVEVRWFGRGEPPRDVVAWYRQASPHAVKQVARVDHYLWQASGAGLGIKLREGCLEVKLRVCALGPVRFAPGIVGSVERWRKWSYALAADAAAPDQNGPGEWVAVAKERLLGRFTLAKGETPVAVDLAPERVAACDCELTTVTLETDRRWWTLAFEAFAVAGDALALLRAVAITLLAQDRTLRLPVEQSHGYAEWLMTAPADGLP